MFIRKSKPVSYTHLDVYKRQAQGFSPAAMEQLKTRRLWSHSQNAAGMPFDDIQNYSNVYWDMTYRTETIAVRKRGRKRLS